MPRRTDEPTKRFALRGRLVTLNTRNNVIDDGVLYVNDSRIAAVLPADAPAPAGFEDVAPIATGGTVYPGLIELHNHLPYDVLPLWAVPEKYGNRSQWGGSSNPAYHTLVTGPMRVLGEDPELMPAVVRYVEAKALVNGTTTTQGIALFSNAGARRMYRGVVRNVEATDDPDLPEAASRIADVEAANAEKFLARLQQPHRLLLHLAEGTDQAARDHFLALKLKDDQWAINQNLVGIHCTGLKAEDFKVLAGHGGSMVWSPLSNLLLYGQTADIAAARKAGVLIGLGSDWSVSGSKGLLGELKAARLAAKVGEVELSDRDLVAMATRDAARILRWEDALGSLKPGLRADLLVTTGTAGDPYTALVKATDTDIRLVVIDGTARFGTRDLVGAIHPHAAVEDVPSGGAVERVVHLQDANADPIVAGLSLAEATHRLATALADLPALAARAGASPPLTGFAADGVRWQLALDELAPTGAELRPRLPLLTAAGRTRPTGPEVGLAAAAAPLAPVALDGLMASADAAFLSVLAHEGNLPADYGRHLSQLLT
ncbi:Cytosine/adenosine deaminase [Streptomyces sp. 3213]|uniref:amidohydrolase family protein n=1 Tax=Streptomyces sp. 3213.3 TaxID=1855348 RepID=UPI0008995165|nr:amidohydrolase family protein [Streptomyces sp. 3213.3]SED64496.1 Cytosine/adenosine deaminase [Streptomyces sp. 3213] [Streptomyces sp. 3213.3]